MHDEITTDKNDPTVNGYGPVYAVSAGHGKLTVLDPIENDAYEITIPTREDARQVQSRFPPPAMPSNFWGMQHLWGPENPADPHNPMMDRKGRVWMTSKIRNEEPAWCREGSSHKFAQYYPLNFSNRQASYYDPATGEFRLIDTCFATHHLQFDNDADQTLYFNELLGPDRRLGQHARVRPHGRRASDARLVPASRRQQRRRQDHEAVERARASPPIRAATPRFGTTSTR